MVSVKIAAKRVAEWPKLAWVAVFPDDAETINVYHGPMVETASDWCAEAVWAGDFAARDFDRTDLVFGSGIRIRDDRVIFVTSSSGVDRLWYGDYSGLWYVSNSLPALLACAGVELCEDYQHYTRDIETIERLGLKRYVRSLPTSAGDVRVCYFTNLLFEGHGLQELEKPDTTPPIKTFEDYRQFLSATAAQLGVNLGDPRRRQRIIPLVGISSGYDSPASAVVAWWAGCRHAVTIAKANSFWRGSDSGEEIAKRLGMSCQCYYHKPSAYRREETFWAAAGRSGGRNLALFDYPEPLCLFFNGSYGDKVWDRRYHDLSEPVGDTDSLLCEFRLIQGMFQTVVPWWGIRHVREIQSVSVAAEMAPWTLQTNYDRPIARRLIEEAGVPRGAFGIRKKDTSSNTSFHWPQSPEGMALFSRYLRERGFRVPSLLMLDLLRLLAHLDSLAALNVTTCLGFDLRLREILRLRGQSLLFHWANTELKQRYLRGLRGLDIPSSAPSTTCTAARCDENP
jgi:hypothetical protein